MLLTCSSWIRVSPVDAVDGEVHGGDLAGDHPLDGLAFVWRHPLLPRGGDVVELDAGGVRDHRDGRAPRQDQDVGVLQQRPELGRRRSPSRSRSRPRSWCSRESRSARTIRTSQHRPMSVIGKRSLAKPGSMPVVKQEAPPSSHASSMGLIQFGGFFSSSATPTASSPSSTRRCRRGGTGDEADVVLGVRAVGP